ATEQARIYRDPAQAQSAPAPAALDVPRYVLSSTVARQLDSAAAGADAIRPEQHHPASQARTAAADRWPAHPSPGAESGAQCGRRPHALRFGGAARRRARDAGAPHVALDRRLDLLVDRVPQAGRPGRRIKRPALRSTDRTWAGPG